jgi:hypothetical protein
MEFNIEEAKELFVREELDQHGEFIMDLLVDSIQDMEIIDTENLLRQLRYNIAKRGNDYILQLSFPGYGRAVEIGYYKRAGNYNVESNDIVKKLFNIQSLDDVNRRREQRNARKLNWYSKNVYGSLNKLYASLSYGFSQDELNRLKNIISNESYSRRESGYIGPPTFGI